MSKIFNFYHDDVDKTWYDSSTVKYSECEDLEGQLKTLKVVFKNGTQYEYSDVDVMDYLLFREDASQGKALNAHVKAKGYKYKKLENVDVTKIEEELKHLTEADFYATAYKDGNDLVTLDIVKNSGEELYSADSISLVTFNVVEDVLDAMGIKVKFDKKWE